MLGFGVVATEGFVAILTGVGSLSRVNAHVVHQMILLTKSGATCLTLKGALRQVRFVMTRLFMIGQAFPVRECFATKGTLGMREQDEVVKHILT